VFPRVLMASANMLDEPARADAWHPPAQALLLVNSCIKGRDMFFLQMRFYSILFSRLFHQLFKRTPYEDRSDLLAIIDGQIGVVQRFGAFGGGDRYLIDQFRTQALAQE